jgi:hypothetical protein
MGRCYIAACMANEECGTGQRGYGPLAGAPSWLLVEKWSVCVSRCHCSPRTWRRIGIHWYFGNGWLNQTPTIDSITSYSVGPRMLGRAIRRLLFTICLLIGLIILFHARYTFEDNYEDDFDGERADSPKLSVDNVHRYPPVHQKQSILYPEHRKAANGLVETVSATPFLWSHGDSGSNNQLIS